MAVIYTLLGVPYEPVECPKRGVVLRKAARRRSSPGQMSLFGSNEPKQGDTKVIDGVTYQLNQHSRWERTDKAKVKGSAKPAIVPALDDKKEKQSSFDVANKQQKEDTGKGRESKDKKKESGMIRIRVDDYDEAQRLEDIAVDLSARINQEGFPTSYGGTGIIVYIQSGYSKKDWKQIISGFKTASFI